MDIQMKQERSCRINLCGYFHFPSTDKSKIVVDAEWITKMEWLKINEARIETGSKYAEKKNFDGLGWGGLGFHSTNAYHQFDIIDDIKLTGRPRGATYVNSTGFTCLHFVK
jgi:hypothetical protein